MTSDLAILKHCKLNMTRSHKYNDRDHAGLADGTAHESEHLPRFFAKSGHTDSDPNKTKKNGGGKGNWGREGDELDDLSYNLTNARRRSNSSTHEAHMKNFKTKFETIEPEPVFEEELHGPLAGDDQSITSTNTGSVEEEDLNKKM
ncbi:hypothetical protein GQ43DRAFT_434192 [Delitschia confertaspora ATCC 74209]|uniref:Hyaluronan/mRNA-binding protein domain-containing protein n=1 Tax=Delitschia confertaspora ATCC 74209 TaxID=1513339 RepID=A0A9P4JKT5_9PLEO|nr:hypothetical protein GQ43DRAFT_434192 [Delitschia confertaspora ATCC 74209]